MVNFLLWEILYRDLNFEVPSIAPRQLLYRVSSFLLFLILCWLYLVDIYLGSSDILFFSVSKIYIFKSIRRAKLQMQASAGQGDGICYKFDSFCTFPRFTLLYPDENKGGHTYIQNENSRQRPYHDKHQVLECTVECARSSVAWVRILQRQGRLCSCQPVFACLLSYEDSEVKRMINKLITFSEIK